ncbi:MAG: tRNA dihydrouridine synthase DusB [Oscillospiraceae bacterium]|jgi:tRNA-dihydrouridine synthase B|nr:tRNA dihydrouridine synthase DusB [Oscillospiraceae bacterium]
MTKRFNLSSPLVLAPMAGITDIAFREVCKSRGAAITYSEMVSAKALVYQDAKSKTLIPRGRGEFPYAVQIFGHEPDVMAEAALKALDLAAPEIIDVNMGCPTPKIVKSGDGCALMPDVALAARIVSAIVAAVGSKVAVTVKTRKGWDNSNINAVELATACEAAGAAAITVHGRTKAQLYSGVADYDIIRDVKNSVSIPVIANGDITDADSAKRVMDYTGADLAMIGRAAMGNPWAFAPRQDGQITLAERIRTAMAQTERAAELKGERVACLEARKHFAWYLKGVYNASRYKIRYAKAVTLDEFRDISNEIISAEKL